MMRDDAEPEGTPHDDDIAERAHREFQRAAQRRIDAELDALAADPIGFDGTLPGDDEQSRERKRRR